MVRFLFRRLAQTLVAVWALASAVFLFSYHNSDQALRLALPDASELTAHPIGVAQTQADLAALRARFGLNQPLFYFTPPATGGQTWHWHGPRNQYHRWLTKVLRGNLGVSFRTGEPVTSRLGRALALTLPLTGTAAALAVILAVVLALRMAAAPVWAATVRTVLVAIHSLPLFVVALGLLLVFANPDVLAWFPSYGLDQPAGYDAGNLVSQYLPYLVLPITTLVLTAVPELTLQLETALSHELTLPYADTARAKGLSIPAVIRQHALRNAALPTLAQAAELLPVLVAGAVAVEVVFALPGMGRLLAEAAAIRDYPVLIGGVLLIGATRLVALLLADIFYSWADPRIQWQA
jgi:peptide/nickel transport system permease protein